MKITMYPGKVVYDTRPDAPLEDELWLYLERHALRHKTKILVVVVPADGFMSVVRRLNARVELIVFTEGIILYTANGPCTIVPDRPIYV